MRFRSCTSKQTSAEGDPVRSRDRGQTVAAVCCRPQWWSTCTDAAESSRACCQWIGLRAL